MYIAMVLVTLMYNCTLGLFSNQLTSYIETFNAVYSPIH